MYQSYYALIVLSFLCFGLKAHPNLLPGSRSIYVRNHSSDPAQIPASLQLSLRGCACARASKPDPNSFCSCWSNFEDQPDVQGDPRNLFEISKTFGEFFSGCGYGVDKESDEQYIIIPSPNSLIRNFKSYNKDQFIKLVPGNIVVTADEYLKYLAQGKIPLGDIPSEEDVAKPKYLYHIYIHDFMNQIFLWIALPEKIRTEISARAQRMLTLFSTLAKTNENDSNVLDYLQLIKSMCVLKFDTRMGTLNNHIFNFEQPFFLIQDVVCPENALTYKKERIIGDSVLLHVMVNFWCWETIKNDGTIDLSRDADWFNFWISYIRDNLNRAKIEGEEKFDSIKSLKKDLEAMKSLHNLLRLCPLEIEKIAHLLQHQARETIGGDQLVDRRRLTSIEEFYSEVRANIREARFKIYNVNEIRF